MAFVKEHDKCPRCDEPDTLFAEWEAMIEGKLRRGSHEYCLHCGCAFNHEPELNKPFTE